MGRQPAAQVISQKKQVTRQSSFSGASPAQKRMSEQKSHYLKIQNIQQRVLDYSHGRDKDAQVPLTNQSQGVSKQDTYASQERVLKLAEDERELLDEMIALNQRHQVELETRKNNQVMTIP